MRLIVGSLFSFVSCEATCTPDPTAPLEILSSLCWSCMFPLKVSGVPVAEGPLPETTAAVGASSAPICVCPTPVGPRPGITVSFYNPNKLIETVKDPMCSPSIGIDLGASGAIKMLAGNKSAFKQQAGDVKLATFQAHSLAFTPLKAMDLLTDFVCVEAPSILDYLYVTEFDPLWQSSMLSTLINPEAILFGSPVAQLACIADAVSSNFRTTLDPLFWCMGSWGNAYPLDGKTTQNDDWVQGAQAISAKLIYKLHRELLLWDESGRYTVCAKIPMPLWNKSMYRMQIVRPIPHPIANVIGESGMLWLWSIGKNIPMDPRGNNFSFVLFSRRGCCAF